MSKLFEANDLDASAAIDLERADALRQEAAALLDRATEKRPRAARLREQAVGSKTSASSPSYTPGGALPSMAARRS